MSDNNDEICSEALKAWLRLVRVAGQLTNNVEQNLKRNKLPPLTWYNILWELKRNEPKTIRPFQIQENTGLLQYNLSRILDRMEKDAIIERVSCDCDGRGQEVKLTTKGHETLGKMWPIYRDSIMEQVREKLNDAEIKQLIGLLTKVNSENLC